jgi:hypothetical protein
LGAASLPEVSRHAKRRFLRSQSVTHFVLAEIAYPSLRLGVVLSSGGGGNRTSGDSPDLDDSRTVSRTGADKNMSKEHEENALADILMTMSQIPDVNRELAEVGAMFAVVDALRRKGGR